MLSAIYLDIRIKKLTSLWNWALLEQAPSHPQVEFPDRTWPPPRIISWLALSDGSYHPLLSPVESENSR